MYTPQCTAEDRVVGIDCVLQWLLGCWMHWCSVENGDVLSHQRSCNSSLFLVIVATMSNPHGYETVPGLTDLLVTSYCRRERCLPLCHCRHCWREAAVAALLRAT